MNRILKNARMLRMVSREEGVFEGDIGIQGQRIAFIGEAPEDFKADEIVDVSGMVLLPGLINTHTHMGMSLLRSYADDMALMEWLSEKIWPIEAELTETDVYYGTLLSAIELIRSGCTTFRDMYFYVDAVARATIEAGIRGHLGLGLISNKDPEGKELKETRALHGRWQNAGEGRIRIEVAPHAPYTNSDAYLKEAVALAQSLDVPLHVHLSETASEVETSLRDHGETPIAHAERLGMLTCHTGAAHCVHMREGDIDILARNHVSVLYNPSSNLKLASGFAPVQDFLDAGVNVALGTDGSSSNNNLNMMEEMHLAAMVNKAVTGDPTVLPAYAVLEMATVAGARALGMEAELGTLEAGKYADLIAVDLRKPHLTPMHDVASALVYAASGSDVRHVMCNGAWVMRDYVIETVDEAVLIDQVNAATEALLKRARK